MKTRRVLLAASLVFATLVAIVACSSPPQYEGGGRHLDVEGLTTTSSIKDSGGSKDTSVADTSVKDTSVAE